MALIMLDVMYKNFKKSRHLVSTLNTGLISSLSSFKTTPAELFKSFHFILYLISILFRFADYTCDFQHNSHSFKLASAFALWRLLRINFEENWGKIFSNNCLFVLVRLVCSVSTVSLFICLAIFANSLYSDCSSSSYFHVSDLKSKSGIVSVRT